MTGKTVFDSIVEEVMGEAGGSWLLEESMSRDINRVSKVPLRYRIIAKGFVNSYSLEELNTKLKDAGCEALYSRSLWEAGLIYSFSHGVKYEEWKAIKAVCDEVREKQEIKDPWFKGSGISMAEFTSYLEESSDVVENELKTRHLTRLISNEITDSKDEEDFRKFLSDNIISLSPVREKSRYYFCKYLYYMLKTKIENYAASIEKETEPEDAFLEIVFFKRISELKRKKHTPEEARQFLLNTDISCGEIFDAFNYFYFEYVSLDWMQVLLEYYGNINNLPQSAKDALCAHLKNYDPSGYGDLTDDEVISKIAKIIEEDERSLDEIYSLDGSSRGYQRNRTGENTIRKYIKGQLDIDRTTLICFLLFFGSEADLSDEDEMSVERVSEIMLECGFPALRTDDEFDCFVKEHLESDDPVDFLMQEVTDYAMQEENFHLYKVYRASVSNSEEIEKII